MNAVGEPHRILIIVGGLLLAGLVSHVVGQRTRLPRVTLLVIVGVLFGSSGFGLLADSVVGWFPVVADMALVMIGFLLGERLTRRTFARVGRPMLIVSVVVVAITIVVVGAGLALLGLPLTMCLLLAGVATSTDPAATVDVVAESESKGPFTETLLAIVAIDDVWGLLAFSLLLAAVGLAAGEAHAADILVAAAWELGGAIGLGAALGIPMAYLTGRIAPGEPTLAEALGVVFLCGGIALWLEVSFLLAAMTLGAVVANRAKHHSRPFHAIEGVEAPFLIMFFILAGASLEVDALLSAGTIGIAFVVFRTISRVAGGWLGGVLGGFGGGRCVWMGVALMPQAGIALGMALLAVERYPELTDQILPVVIASTVVFELLGPIATKAALSRVGEAACG